jgi:GNAT superfamily N-acetyltransferase
MLREASRDDLDAIRALLGRANDAPYDLARVAEEKCFGRGYGGAPVVHVFEEEGTIAGVSVTCGHMLRVLAVDRDLRLRGFGSALLAEAERRAHVVFAEGGNYFTPGVVEEDQQTRSFFRKHGYIESRWTWNLETANLPVSADDGVLRASHADRERVLAFIEHEFGAMWRFECSRAFEREVPPLFFAEHAGEITGFAAYDINNASLGFFGPTGVARKSRGRGCGRSLLMASLAEMRRMGYERAVIPWTEALDFYRKSCDAEPTHRFVTLTRSDRRRERRKQS